MNYLQASQSSKNSAKQVCGIQLLSLPMFPVEFADCVPALTGQGANTLCQNGLAELALCHQVGKLSLSGKSGWVVGQQGGDLL